MRLDLSSVPFVRHWHKKVRRRGDGPGGWLDRRFKGKWMDGKLGAKCKMRNAGLEMRKLDTIYKKQKIMIKRRWNVFGFVGPR
jgi:hypothetical protein